MPDKIQNMRHRISCSYLTVMLIALLGVSAPVLSNTPARVALIADKASDLYKSPLVSLVEVKLSQKEGIELLERAEIDKLLQEQQLSVAGLLQRHNAVKVGRLLRVDAFLLLSTEADKDQKQNSDKLLRVRLVETAHGLRLLDSFEEHGSAKLEDTVKRITEKVIAAAPKMMLPPSEVIPVGIIGIHRVQLSERYQWLARAVPAMLSVRLSKELRIIMLEREDLKILHDEKLLTEGEDAEFWSSGVLIDGYLRRRRTKDIEMKLSLRRASGKGIADFTVLVEPNEPLVAVDNIANNMIQQLLNASPTASWQPEQEAKEFFHQGQLLRNHQRNEDALAPLETAHALRPGNVYYTGGLFANEWDTRSLEKGSFYSDLELAELVSLLVRQIRNGYANGKLPQSEVLLDFGQPLGYETDRRGHLAGYFARPSSVSTDKIRHINRENRKIWTETVKEAVKNWDGSPKQSAFLKFTAWVSSDEPEELIENLRETFSKFFIPREIGNGRRFIEARGALIFPQLSIRVNELEKTHLKGSAKKFQELWLLYLEDLTKVSDPIVRFASYVALSRHYGLGSYQPKNYNTAKNYCKAAMKVLLKELKSPNEPVGDMYGGDLDKWFIRSAMYRALIDSRSMHDPNERITIFTTIFNPLIEKSDARNVAIWSSAFKTDSLWYNIGDIEMAERYTHLLKRIEGVLKDSKDGWENTELNKIKDRLVKIRNEFPQLQPSQEPRKFIAKMLLIKEDWPGKSNTFKYTRLLLQGNMLWIAFAEPGIGLAGIDLTEKK